MSLVSQIVSQYYFGISKVEEKNLSQEHRGRSVND